MNGYEGLRAVAEDADRDGVESGEILAALGVLRELRADLARWEPQLIAAARERGTSWAELAPALGVASRQAAERRYLRLRRPDTEESTADGRVRAERDRRAGDRAVAEWARDNSASLRKLAAMVAAAEGTGDPARPHIDRVERALGENDPVILLQPLAGAGPHLKRSHPDLAEQVDDVNTRAERVRRETVDRRESLR
ncbi:HSP18 transcriptional regulator [Prauserella cavernicola]|uniref:HSP18 transcriptional regulator n=1 Tax=Prauserella cavernicola TaxID=2800127 RepID=A0A934QM61_9PSEU|nr:HSP18 transcriptional regulator [Prauserella cavernicola]MBK1784267.1 HSP18 transcriptional regulator [Prauserella cavernicola]